MTRTLEQKRAYQRDYYKKNREARKAYYKQYAIDWPDKEKKRNKLYKERRKNMLIGKDGYDVPTFNNKEEEQIKLQTRVDKWWYDLEENYKYELMEDYYPDDSYLMEVDAMWEGLDWNDKWNIYRNEKDEVYI